MKDNRATTNWMNSYNLAWINCYGIGLSKMGSWKPTRIIGDE